MTRRPPSRAAAALAALLVLLLALPAPAAAQVGPRDLENARRLLAEEVLPEVGKVYEATACRYVGGSVVFHPPVVGEAGLVTCADPWCHPWLVVSVMCFQFERFVNPDPRHSGICVVYQTVTPETVEVPAQDAITPLQLRCLDPLRHTSFYGGYCDSFVKVSCLQDEPLRDCLVYVSSLGCSDLGTGECRQAVQTFCLGYYTPMDGSTRFRAFCFLWVEALQTCVTPSDGSMPDQSP